MKKIIIIGAILLVMLVGGLCFFNSKFYLGKRFESAVNRKDCDTVYKLLAIKENEYFSKEVFIDQCKNEIGNYKEENITWVGRKIENKIVDYYEDIRIIYPSDAVLEIDGKIVNLDYDLDENEIYKILNISLYEGVHSFKILNEVSMVEKNIHVNGEDIYLDYENDPINIVILTKEGCAYSKNLNNFLKTIDNNIFKITSYNIWDNKNYYLREKMMDIFNYEVIGTPVMIVGDKYFNGYDSDKHLEYTKAIYEAYRNKKGNVLD